MYDATIDHFNALLRLAIQKPRKPSLPRRKGSPKLIVRKQRRLARERRLVIEWQKSRRERLKQSEFHHPQAQQLRARLHALRNQRRQS